MSLLTFLPLLLTLLLPLLLSLLLASLTLLPLLLPLLLASLTLLSLLLPLLLSVPARSSFIQAPAQRIKVVCQLSRAIEVLLRSRTIRATRALLSRLQTFGKVVETAFDRTFVIAAALLTLLLTLLALLLTGIQRLLAFTNAIRNAIARQ